MTDIDTKMSNISLAAQGSEQLGIVDSPRLPWPGHDSLQSISDIAKAISSSRPPMRERFSMDNLNSVESFSTAVEKFLAGSFTQEFPSHLDDTSSSNGAQSDKQDLEAVLPSGSIEPAMSLSHKTAFVFIACLAQFLSLGGMNQSVAPVMILAGYFNIHDYGTLSWFSAAYSMTLGACILPAGRLGDMYGHKRVFMVGWLWFASWSVVCGFGNTTSNVVLFSTCRAMQGIGPALLVPNAIALLGRNFAVGAERNTAFACFAAAGPTGATAGAVFSALVAELFWWPWCFWILAAVCVCVCFVSFLIVPGGLTQEKTAQRPPFDIGGCVTGVTGLILVNFALNQAPLVGWTVWYIPSLLIMGLASLLTFVVIELKFTKHPLIPIRGLGSEAYFALGCIAAGWGSHGIWAYYLYLFLEQVKGHSALLTSAMTAPVALTGVLFAISTVWLLRRVPVSYVMFLAMCCFLVGSMLLALLPLEQTYWLQTFLSIIIMPGAMNLSFPAATILLSTALPRDKQGIAASLVATTVNYCIASGLGLAGTIHRHSLERAGRKYGHLEHGDGHPSGPPPSISVSSPEMSRVRIEAMRGPWWFAVGLSAVGVTIASVFILRTQRKPANP